MHLFYSFNVFTVTGKYDAVELQWICRITLQKIGLTKILGLTMWSFSWKKWIYFKEISKSSENAISYGLIKVNWLINLPSVGWLAGVPSSVGWFEASGGFEGFSDSFRLPLVDSLELGSTSWLSWWSWCGNPHVTWLNRRKQKLWKVSW